MLDGPAYLAIAIFAVAYALFAWKEERRLLVAAVGGVGSLLLALVEGLLPWNATGFCTVFGYDPAGSPWHVCPTSGYVEWDTLGLLVGLFLLAALLDVLQVFRYLAVRIAGHARGHPVELFLLLSLLSFTLSAFINSITVMVVLASLTFEVARLTGLSPVPLLLAEISASNAGGAATLVGDPPNVILGSYFGLGFDDFVVHAGPLALAALAVVLAGFGLIFLRRIRTERVAPERVRDAASRLVLPRLERVPVALALGAFAVTLTLVVLNNDIPPSLGELGLLGGALALLAAGRARAAEVVARVDWSTLAFFFFLFLLIGSLEVTGVISALAQGLFAWAGGNVLLLASLLLWVLGLLSSIIDNVPLAAAVAPLIGSLQRSHGIGAGSLVYASAVGTDVGGNGTPIGASANVVALSAARKAGVPISWKEYVSAAFPIMVGSLLAANLVLLVWH